MKKILSISLSTLLVFSFIYSCSSDEEAPPPNIVQTPDPETPAPTPILYTLTVSSGEGGSVSSEGGTYDEGTSVTITATPDEGYEFIGWEGDDSLENTITVVISNNFNLSALFELTLDEQNVDDLSNELDSFFNKYGGRENFENKQILALETLLSVQEDIEENDLSSARNRLDYIFNLIPLSDNEWNNISYNTNSTNSHCTSCPINIGGPVAYYGLRMLDQIVTLGLPSNGKTLKMTAVIASCANVTRPRLDLTHETIPLEINPKIIENDGYVLKISTELFRKWVQAITNGSRVDLQFYIVNDCIDVNYSISDDGGVIFSYISDVKSFIDKVPLDIAEATDFWWTITPSGVPGDGSGFNKHFITGGMGGYRRTGDTRYNRPVFLSDDAWFVRKPEHMGLGEYHEIELKAYQPQWFQHEFMHYLYGVWDEYDLERLGGTNNHGWFDRNKWPSDFTGSFEPDYYAETITKRLITANPSLENGLEFPGSPYSSLIDPNDYSIDDIELFVGNYRREPVENDWHIVEIINSNGNLSWQNNAGVSWSLSLIEGKLWAGLDSAYGEQKLGAFVDSNGEILSLVFNGEVFTKVSD